MTNKALVVEVGTQIDDTFTTSRSQW